MLAILAVVAVTIGAVLLIRPGSGRPAGAPGPIVSTPPVAPSAPAPSLAPTATASGTPSSTAPAAAAFRFQPLWPFGSTAEAVAWQRDARPGGTQAWRLDAGQTALSFARGFLGYTEIDQVLSRQVAGDQAWVGVAGTPPEGRATTAAVLHLARIGSGSLATRPWEVVGSRDTLLTLTTPRYGATVGRSFTVGGRITGVDESLDIQVRSLSGGRIGRVIGIPAGGTNQPWTAEVTVNRDRPGLATVAVSTGGHLQQVERFAVTAVRIRPDRPAARSFATPEGALASLVANGTYVGDCDAIGSPPTVDDPVCSNAGSSHDGRYLYRVGYYQTDAGFFVILGRNADGRWTVIDPNVPGEDVPAELGGPINE